MLQKKKFLSLHPESLSLVSFHILSEERIRGKREAKKVNLERVPENPQVSRTLFSTTKAGSNLTSGRLFLVPGFTQRLRKIPSFSNVMT